MEMSRRSLAFSEVFRKPLQAIRQRQVVSGAILILRPGKNTCRMSLVEFQNGIPTSRHDQWFGESDVSPLSRLPISEHLTQVCNKRHSRRLKALVLLSRNDCCFARNLIQSVRPEDLHETAMLQAECSFPETIQDLVIDYVSVQPAENDRALLMTTGKDRSTIDAMRTQLIANGITEIQILPESATACLSLGRDSDESELVLAVGLRPQGRLEVLAHHRGVLVSHQGRHLSEPSDESLRAKQIYGEIVRSLGVLESVTPTLFTPAVQLIRGAYDHVAVLRMLHERHPSLKVEVRASELHDSAAWAIDDPFESLVVSGASELLKSAAVSSHNLAQPRRQLSRLERRRRLLTRTSLASVLVMIALFWWSKTENDALQAELSELQQQIDELQGRLDQQAAMLNVSRTMERWQSSHALPQELMGIIEACLPAQSVCRIRRLRINRTELMELPADVELEGSADTTDTVVQLSETLLKTGRFKLHPYQVDRGTIVTGLPVEFTFRLTATSRPAVDSAESVNPIDSPAPIPDAGTNAEGLQE